MNPHDPNVLIVVFGFFGFCVGFTLGVFYGASAK